MRPSTDTDTDVDVDVVDGAVLVDVVAITVVAVVTLMGEVVVAMDDWEPPGV